MDIISTLLFYACNQYQRWKRTLKTRSQVMKLLQTFLLCGVLIAKYCCGTADQKANLGKQYWNAEALGSTGRVLKCSGALQLWSSAEVQRCIAALVKCLHLIAPVLQCQRYGIAAVLQSDVAQQRLQPVANGYIDQCKHNRK